MRSGGNYLEGVRLEREREGCRDQWKRIHSHGGIQPCFRVQSLKALAVKAMAIKTALKCSSHVWPVLHELQMPGLPWLLWKEGLWGSDAWLAALPPICSERE